MDASSSTLIMAIKSSLNLKKIEIMENLNVLPTALLATIILGFVQLITRLWPKTNAMQVTLIVSAVVTVIGFVWVDSIGYLEAILAIFGQVFVYDTATKTFK
jgi:hypothetical protein